MAGLNLLGVAATWPGGMWGNFIKLLYNVIGNYGLTIILITLIIKVILLPLDVWQKYSQKVMSTAQTVMAPELAKLQKRYANDKQMLNQKQSELYKKNNVSPIGNCLSMLINLVVMSAVMFTLFGAINKISAFKVEDQFRQLNTVYEQTINSSTAGTDEAKVIDAQNAVVVAYDTNKNIKESFLWIKNVWRKDGAETVIPEWKDAEKTFSKEFKAELNITEANYNKVMGVLLTKRNSNWNGYYILTILAVATTFLSTKLMTMQTKKKSSAVIKTEQEAAMSKTGNITQFLMPVLMGVFTIFSSSTFAIYLVSSQVFTIIFNFAVEPIANQFIKIREKKIAKKIGETEVSYRR